MTEILFRRCDGGEKGELCKKLIEKACKNFFKCDVPVIERICNDKRVKLMKVWQGKNPDEPMLEYGLRIPFKQGIEEITPLFELNEPKRIEVYILKGEKSQGNNGLAAMEIRPFNKLLTEWELHAYLDVMDYSGNNLRWRGFQETIEEITYHELLHACGDIPWRGKHDGILRHNLIGINAVEHCIQNTDNTKESR